MIRVQESLKQAKKYHRAGQLQLAEPIYRWILQVHSTHADAHYLLGALCEASARLEEAEAHLRQAVRLRPQYAQPHNHLGMVLVKQGKRNDAIASFQQALRLDPDLIEALNNLGMTFRDQGHLARRLPVSAEWSNYALMISRLTKSLGMSYCGRASWSMRSLASSTP